MIFKTESKLGAALAMLLILVILFSGCVANNKKEVKEKDIIPPTVLITSPADGSTVNGTLTISVQANDIVSVSAVEIYIDNELKNEDTTQPYEWGWNTRAYANELHTIKAVAYDSSGNNGYHQITVSVRNEAEIEQPAYREEREQFSSSIEAKTGECCIGNTHNWNVSANARKIVAILNWSDTGWDLDIEIGVGEDAENGTVKDSDSGGAEGDGEGTVTLIYEPVANPETGEWFAHITTEEKTIANGGTKFSWETCEYDLEVIIYYLD